MSGLPTGTVTFVFTDIEGSTSLLKALGDDYGEVLSTHRRLMRDCFGTRGGVEIDTQGDAFFFAFPERGTPSRQRSRRSGCTRHTSGRTVTRSRCG